MLVTSSSNEDYSQACQMPISHVKSFLDRFALPEPPPLESMDLHLALTVLLVRIARIDRNYTDDEQIHIEELVADSCQISISTARELRQEAETIEASSTDSVRFTRIIKEQIPFTQRETVLELLWEIVLSDGVRDHKEDSFLRLVANLLGVTDRDSAIARQRVISRTGS